MPVHHSDVVDSGPPKLMLTTFTALTCKLSQNFAFFLLLLHDLHSYHSGICMQEK